MLSLALLKSFFLKNKLPIFLVLAVIATGYFSYLQLQNIAELKATLKLQEEEVANKTEEYRLKLEGFITTHAKEISALVKLSEQISLEAERRKEKDKKVSAIVKEVEIAPESKDWYNAPLPDNVVDSLHRIYDELQQDPSPAN